MRSLSRKILFFGELGGFLGGVASSLIYLPVCLLYLANIYPNKTLHVIFWSGCFLPLFWFIFGLSLALSGRLKPREGDDYRILGKKRRSSFSLLMGGFMTSLWIPVLQNLTNYYYPSTNALFGIFLTLTVPMLVIYSWEMTKDLEIRHLKV